MSDALISVDCTGPGTIAVLRHRDGRIELLHFAGATELPTGVFQQDDGELLTGRAALDAATARPDRYVATPLRRLTGAGHDDGSAELVTAVLACVREQATRTAGIPVTHAVVVVPPGWGPQRRTRLRHAAHHAGLTEIEVVDAATALAHHHGGQAGPHAQAILLICRLAGGEADATILRPDGDTFETLATIERTDLSTAAAAEATAQVVSLAGQALDAADLTGTVVTTVVLAAPAAYLPGIAGGLRELGAAAPVRTAANTGAVHGALTLAAGVAPVGPSRLRQARHAVAIAVPLTGAAILLWLLLDTEVYPLISSARLTTSGPPQPLVHWPAWSMIAVLACFGALAAVLHHADQRWKHSTQDTEADRRAVLARGLHVIAAAAAATGITTAMLAVNSHPTLPVSGLLFWAVGPALALAGVAAVIAALVRQGYTSALRWQIWLRLPNAAVVLAVTGLLAVCLDLYLRQPGSTPVGGLASGRTGTGIDRLGAIAAALAILPLLLRRTEHQLLVSPLVIAMVLFTHSFSSTGLVVGALLVATFTWWVMRVRPAAAYSDPNHPATVLAAGTERYPGAL